MKTRSRLLLHYRADLALDGGGIGLRTMNGIDGVFTRTGASSAGDSLNRSYSVIQHQPRFQWVNDAMRAKNVLINSSFELGALGWAVYDNQAIAVGRINRFGMHGGQSWRTQWTGTNTGVKGVTGGSVEGAVAYKPLKTYVISWYARVATAIATGMALNWNTAPASTTVMLNPNLATSWQRYATMITWGATVDSGVNITITNAFSTGTNALDIDAIQIEEVDPVTATGPTPYAPRPHDLVPALVLSSGELLYWIYRAFAMPMTIYTRFFETGTRNIASARLWSITSAADGNPRLYVSQSGANYSATHDTGTGVSSTVALPALNSMVESRVTLDEAGVVTAAQTLWDDVEVVGTPSAIKTLVNPWADTRFYLNSGGSTNPGANRFRIVKVANGIRSLDQIRADM